MNRYLLSLFTLLACILPALLTTPAQAIIYSTGAYCSGTTRYTYYCAPGIAY